MGVLEKILENLSEINSKLDELGGNSKQSQDVFNVEQAAEFLKISEDKVYSMIRNNEIDYVRIGNRKVITEQAILHYISENTVSCADDKKYKNNITSIRR